jgi:glycosyltransferase involved in cell wall biosynthesis
LTHAFSYPDHGSEIVSLPCVKNIDFRIVINQKTLDDYKILYKRNNISEKYINHFRIIPNGITIQKFDENLIKKRFDQFTIGFVGRNSKEKRSELFFQLVGLLKLKGKVIGDDFSEFKPNFKGISYFEGCNDSTLIRKEFSTISLLVVSSSREGFPLVVMEAMEMGIPVIASNVGSIYEHVKDDINGYLAPSDPVAFVLYVAEKVNYLNANLHLYKSLSINARQYAEENFNIIQFRKEYINLLS